STMSAGSRGARGGEGWGRLEASDVTIRWGEQILAEGMSGTIRPELSLSSPEGHLRRGEAGWAARVPWETPVGSGVLTVSGETILSARLEVETARLAHRLLGPRPLPPAPLIVDATWDRRSQQVHGSTSIGEIHASFSGTASIEPIHVRLDVQAPEVALVDLVGLFGDAIPEARSAEMAGHFSLALRAEGPPLSWSATLGAEGLAARDVILNPERYAFGRLRGYEGPWTSISKASMLSEAIIAAEDATFWTHPGYDVEALNVALSEVAANAERPRGGSTLTQQLAKNLFLDGERTITRKLRELLYALDLEHSLDKRRILELYLNIVAFGPDIVGAHAASEAYFLKSTDQLMPQEAALLAAVLPSPHRWHGRIRRGQLPMTSITRIVSNMVATGALSPDVARWSAVQRPVVVF
ncbi:MAG: biosynthetic peptidoglycan transglycosylase, partial [Myxococcota bacterium]